jgi:hypothetical protein
VVFMARRGPRRVAGASRHPPLPRARSRVTQLFTASGGPSINLHMVAATAIRQKTPILCLPSVSSSSVPTRHHYGRGADAALPSQGPCTSFAPLGG